MIEKVKELVESAIAGGLDESAFIEALTKLIAEANNTHEQEDAEQEKAKKEEAQKLFGYDLD